MSRPLRFSANLNWLYTEQPIEIRPSAAAAAQFRAIEHPQPYHLPASRWGDSCATPASSKSWSTPNWALRQRYRVRRRLHPRRKRGIPRRVRAGTPVHRRHRLPDDQRQSRSAATRPLTKTGHRHVRGESRLGLVRMRWADVSLLIEAINSGDRPGAFIQRQEQAAELIGILGSDRIRLLFDFYHCQTAQGDLTRTFQRHAPLIGHVQVADVPTRPEPGTGELNYAYLFDVVRQSDSTGWTGLGYAPTSSTDASLAWLPADHHRRTATATKEQPAP
jgi:hydroxypyruvate isomerase